MAAFKFWIVFSFISSTEGKKEVGDEIRSVFLILLLLLLSLLLEDKVALLLIANILLVLGNAKEVDAIFGIVTYIYTCLPKQQNNFVDV